MIVRMVSVVALVLLTTAGRASAQGPSVSVQVGGGPTLVDAGQTFAATVGFWPNSRIAFMVDVQRTHLDSRVTTERFGDVISVSTFRGGTLVAVTGEFRFAPFPSAPVSPYIFGGLGTGRSRPNVNERFPEPVTNTARFMSGGAGVTVPIGDRFSAYAETRLLFGAEGTEGLLGMWPVRVGVGWRF